MMWNLPGNPVSSPEEIPGRCATWKCFSRDSFPRCSPNRSMPATWGQRRSLPEALLAKRLRPQMQLKGWLSEPTGQLCPDPGFRQGQAGSSCTVFPSSFTPHCKTLKCPVVKSLCKGIISQSHKALKQHTSEGLLRRADSAYSWWQSAVCALSSSQHWVLVHLQAVCIWSLINGIYISKTALM